MMFVILLTGIGQYEDHILIDAEIGHESPS